MALAKLSQGRATHEKPGWSMVVANEQNGECSEMWHEFNTTPAGVDTLKKKIAKTPGIRPGIRYDKSHEIIYMESPVEAFVGQKQNLRMTPEGLAETIEEAYSPQVSPVDFGSSAKPSIAPSQKTQAPKPPTAGFGENQNVVLGAQRPRNIIPIVVESIQSNPADSGVDIS